jgi:hypothetical protein
MLSLMLQHGLLLQGVQLQQAQGRCGSWCGDMCSSLLLRLLCSRLGHQLATVAVMHQITCSSRGQALQQMLLLQQH